MAENKLTAKTKIKWAEKAYRRFMAVIRELTREQRRIVEEAIREIEEKQLTKLRKNI